VKFKGGAAGRPQVQLHAKGTRLPMPVPISSTEFFEQDPTVLVQLHSSSPAACWSSAFDGSSTRKNNGARFTATER
jgi:hypothetical protein